MVDILREQPPSSLYLTFSSRYQTSHGEDRQRLWPP